MPNLPSLILEPLSWARRAADPLLALLYPEVCQLCGLARATPAQGFVCDTCRAEVRLISEPLCHRCGMPFPGAITQSFVCSNCHDEDFHFSCARSAALAEGKLLEAIHGYKYHAALWFEPFLAGLLIDSARRELSVADWDLIVPVPLYPAKKRERGFNQAERLARLLSDSIGLPLETRVARRLRPTKTQTRLTRAERKQNVRNAFAVAPRSSLDGRRIVLVDDVFTTGATTDACARALRQAGASAVCVWTVARGT